MSDRIPMTRTGYEKIKAELDHMQNVELPKVLEGLAAARAEGDLSENAEYHGRRETHAMLEARIGAIRDKLSRAVLVDPSQFPKDQVSFGCTVVVKDLDFGDEEEFTLVGAGEEDTTPTRFSSPPPGPRAQRQEGGREGRDSRAPRQGAIRDSGDPSARVRSGETAAEGELERFEAAIGERLRLALELLDESNAEYENGRFGWASDPEGNRFELWEPRGKSGYAGVSNPVPAILCPPG